MAALVDAFRGRHSKVTPCVLREHNGSQREALQTTLHRCEFPTKTSAHSKAGSWPSIQTLAHLGGGGLSDLEALAIDDSPAALTRNTLLLTILTAAATTTSADIRARLFFTLFQLHVAPVVPDAVHARLVRLLGTLLNATKDDPESSRRRRQTNDDDRAADDKQNNKKRTGPLDDKARTDDDDAPQYISFSDDHGTSSDDDDDDNHDDDDDDNQDDDDDDNQDDDDDNHDDDGGLKKRGDGKKGGCPTNSGAPAAKKKKKKKKATPTKGSGRCCFETLAVRGDELDLALRRGLACVSLGKRKKQVAQVCAAWLRSATTAGDAQRHFQIRDEKKDRSKFLEKCKKYGLDPTRTGRREYDLWSRERRVGLPRKLGNSSVWDSKELDFSGQTTEDLRFAIGESVDVYLGSEGWFSGRVVDFYYRERDWEEHDFAPYQVALDDDPRLIFAPEDDDALVKSKNRTKRTKDGYASRPNLTFLDAKGNLPGFYETYRRRRRRQRQRTQRPRMTPTKKKGNDNTAVAVGGGGENPYDDDDDDTLVCDVDDDDDDENLMPLDHLFDLGASFGLLKADDDDDDDDADDLPPRTTTTTTTATATTTTATTTTTRTTTTTTTATRSNEVSENENSANSLDAFADHFFFSDGASSDEPDDVLPCLFDLVKRIYGLAAETFLRHNVCFDFGQGATIDTSLALIHVRRVDLSRALSCQLFAKKKQLQANKAAKQRKRLQKNKRLNAINDDNKPPPFGFGVVSACCGYRVPE